MKLINKKTGAIYSIEDIDLGNNQDGIWLGLTKYTSLAELNEGWEDYDETKEWYWFIEDKGTIKRSCHYEKLHPTLDNHRKDIGNYFESREEAEKAVEKLKAITRLKSCRFKFKGWRTADLGADKYYFVITAESDGAGKGDLDLLFGGEE